MTCLDWSDVEGSARELVGNHRRFDSFCWHDRPDDDGENWTIVYTHNRDSGLLEQSNADAIEQELQPFIEAGDVLPEHHGHFLCGWIDGYAIRVWQTPPSEDGDAEVTEAFRTWCYLKQRLSDYAVLDETDYSRREYEATLENIECEGRRHVRDDAPDDWPGQVFDWLWNSDEYPNELENRDDQGGYPSREALRACLMDLDLLDATYLVTVGETVQLETDSIKKASREFGTIAYHASMGLAGYEQERLCLLCDDEILEQYPETDE